MKNTKAAMDCMEHIYALGVSVIQFIQEWFKDSEEYFDFINNVSNPHYALEVAFPLLAIVDSVFASQLCLCMAFGGWLNAVMKWWFLEHRPYWWVGITSMYAHSPPPTLRQTRHTCETGPGCPSGHSSTAAMMLLLTLSWISHIFCDRKINIVWWKYIVVPLFGVILGSVMLARMFVATHFPHQVLFGALIGAFLAPALCIYVIDPYVWQYGLHSDTVPVSSARLWHVCSALCTVLIAVLTYWAVKLCGVDPLWTVQMAFRYCENPSHIHVSTTPMYALVHCTGHMLGWAMCVTPVISQYRHDTKNRSVILAAITTALVMYSWKILQANIDKDTAWKFYLLQFLLCTIKPPILLRFVPAVAMYPFKETDVLKVKKIQ